MIDSQGGRMESRESNCTYTRRCTSINYHDTIRSATTWHPLALGAFQVIVKIRRMIIAEEFGLESN